MHDDGGAGCNFIRESEEYEDIIHIHRNENFFGIISSSYIESFWYSLMIL